MVWISCRDSTRWISFFIFVAVLITSDAATAADGYYGKFIGKLTQLHHGVSGEVYAVDARTLHLRNFNYDGEGPAAYFYAGNTKIPSGSGFRLRDERGTTNVLPRYRNKHITITLPEGKTLQHIRWFSVWCDEFSVNFGDVKIPKNLDFPRPQKIGTLSGVHGVSSDQVVIVDAQTLLIPSFSYDGEAPDAKFWVGRGPKPSPQGIRVPDENGKELPLRRYDRKTIVLTLPGDLTVFDIGHFGVWCEAFTVDFGHVQIPRGLNVPPSLKMLGVSPQKRSRSLALPINVQNQFENQFGSQEQSQQNIDNPIFYHDFKAQPKNLQEIRPTTYKPQYFRPVQQVNNDVFEIQKSISIPHNNEFIINEQTGDFVNKPLDIQHSRRQEVRYEPTPAEKILQHNPAEPNQEVYQNGLVYNQQPIVQQRPVLVPDQNQIVNQPPPPPPPVLVPQQTYQVENYQQQPQHFVQQQYQPQSSNIYEQRATNHYGTIFDQQNIEANINHTPELGAGSFSRFSKLNCEVLWDDLAFEVRWAVAGDSIVLQLVAKLENGEYMAFGLSGEDNRSRMVGGDVTVAWVDKDTLKGHAVDYYLDAKSQCSGGRGSCPDENIAEKSNSVRLLNAALVNGYSIVTFQRSLKAQDEFDKPVHINASQPVIWALGPLNARQEVSYHSLANRGDIQIDFGRPPKWNCPTPETQSSQSEPEQSSSDSHKTEETNVATVERVTETRHQSTTRREPQPRPKPPTQVPTPAPAPKNNAWEIPPIQCYEPEDGVFYAQMGPTGGKRGYPAITGHVGWGISWYINGLLIPEINVVRGRTYTFIVEGGLDPQTPARYHPFYITDDPVGGYEHKTPEERANIQIFAGAVQNKRGEVRPTGTGRLCNWTPDQSQPPADEFSSFGAYQRTLRLECDPGEPGIVQWTVGLDTPDTVYYQCYTHRYLGWKINVLDNCEREEASEPIPSVVQAPSDVIDKISHDDSDGVSSIIHSTKVKPDSKHVSRFASKPGKNQTKTAPNDFIEYEPQITFVPEYTFYNEETGEPISAETLSQLKYQGELKNLPNPFAMQDPFIQQHVMQQLAPQVPPPQQTQQQFANIPAPIPEFKNNDQFIKFFHTPQPQGLLQAQDLEHAPSFGRPLGLSQHHVLPQPHGFPQTHHGLSQPHGLAQPHNLPQPQSLEQQPQGLSMYSVNENVNDGAATNQHTYPVLPISLPQIRKPEAEVLANLHNHKYHVKADVTEPHTAQQQYPVQLENVQQEDFKIDEKFNEEFLKNYNLLKAQAEENLKKQKQKLQYYNKPMNRLPNGQVIGPPNRLQHNQGRRPPAHHALTLQQRPVPPGMFRPPFLPPPVNKAKRPAQAASQKVPTYAHPNNIPNRRPQKPHRPNQQKVHQIKLQQYLALQKQLEQLTTVKPEIDTSALLTSSPIIVDKATDYPVLDNIPNIPNIPNFANVANVPNVPNVPIAINTGFNPDSVKVEGGFKPILSTGIAPKFDMIDRMDETAPEDDEEVEDKIGVIDLTKEDQLGEKSALFKDTKDELIKVEKNVTEENKTEELDLFKNQKPQMFEPMFIPSPPDNRIQKYQEKYKKKPVAKYGELKNRNNQLQHYNTQKNGNNYYVKIRPRPNLIRRPLYPNNMIPPFQIPARGGSPQYRYQQSEESVEDTTDFDIISMNNDTVNTDDDTAENILEVIEMDGDKDNATESIEQDEEFEGELVSNTTEDEIAMADERRDFYLPPKPDGVVTFDGKIVHASPAPTLPSRKSSIDISKLPQSVPFRGEIPPLTQSFRTDNLPQLKNTKSAPADILPPSSYTNPSTRLSPVSQYESQPSEVHETVLQVTNESSVGAIPRDEEARSRQKRSPDHIPGHEGHDHDDHDHDHHHDHSSNNAFNLLPNILVLFGSSYVQRFL